MKILIFAGGTGRRLWPISRQATPKQFEPIVGDRSTVQMTFDRIKKRFESQDIYISSNERYLPLLREQLPELSPHQFIGEPTRRDLAAAVGLAMVRIQAQFGHKEPVAIVWGDNYMTDEETFLDMLIAAERILVSEIARIVYFGEAPRFANDNLGWIGLGEQIDEVNGLPYFAYQSWHYRPPLEECQRMFSSGRYVWNTGYFVTTPGFITAAYEKYQPKMWSQLSEIKTAIGAESYEAVLHTIYPAIEMLSFDDAIVQHIDPSVAVVVKGATGWSDPGTLYALKEAINPNQDENVELGLTTSLNTKDCLLYNYEDNKLLAAIGLEGMIVINMNDALLVVHKNDIPKVKRLVDNFRNTDLEKFS